MMVCRRIDRSAVSVHDMGIFVVDYDGKVCCVIAIYIESNRIAVSRTGLAVARIVDGDADPVRNAAPRCEAVDR
jgi:hypothetical protein